MKSFNHILISIVLVLTCIDVSAQNCNLKLPTPDPNYFLANLNEQDDYLYLVKYISGASKKKHTKTFEGSSETCEFTQTFNNKITYTINQCSEAGADVQIVFPNYCKKELEKFIEWTFKNYGNKWNSDKTKYIPIEEEAGCYIEIKKNKQNNYLIEYYCGC